MKCDVFRGLGGTAYKYYVLFQHHLPPPPATYTSGKEIWLLPSVALALYSSVKTPVTDIGDTDAPETTLGYDQIQLVDTYVAPSKIENVMGYISGQKRGVSVFPLLVKGIR